ncbi:MAG: alanine racemase [Negativicutes bacterium]|nr:alanine racemase [Negativicutes bacterium]
MRHYLELDTPALLVDKTIMERNLQNMAEKARRWGVALRPHTKTHRTPEIAKLQVAMGASGITVAKVGEAEVMAAAGLSDIFIANEVYGDAKMVRLRELNRKIRIAVGVDNEEQVVSLSRFFAEEARPIDVLIEIETGEERTGVLDAAAALELAKIIQRSPGVKLRGIFTHEGHTYGAANQEACRELFRISQEFTLDVAKYLRSRGIDIEVVSIGATPSVMLGDVLPGITEIRPGTYVFMDAAQANAVGSYRDCALTVLSTVISKPTAERVVLDAGGKALTSFTRVRGICETRGYGVVKGLHEIRLAKVYDEHGVILDKSARETLSIGQKVEIIPNHVCPTCNLYDTMHIIENGQIIAEWPILCRGKSQ